MLTKEQLTDAHEQGLSISTRNGNIKIVTILGDVYGVNHCDTNSKLVKWWMFENFERNEATIEQPKQKIDLSILKKGEIYFAKGISSYEYIFMFDKLVNNRIMVKKGYTITDKYETSEFLANVNQLTELLLPTESELELFYSKFPDLKPKKYNGRAVKCYTVEQANYIATNRKFKYNFNEEDLDQFIYINLNINEWAVGDYYNQNNYEIISFSDYCKENGIKEPKWIQGFEVKDGYNDVVMVCDDNLSWELGRLIKVENDSFPFILDSDCSWKYCRYPKRNEINEIKFVD